MEGRVLLLCRIDQLQVPFEALKRTTRERKYAIDDLKETLGEIKSVAHSAAAASPPSVEATLDSLNTCLRDLKRLKRKLDAASAAEREDAQRCCTRLEHLKELGHPQRDGNIEWNRSRINRLLVDHMLRGGNLKSAEDLVRRAGLGELTDLHIFSGAQEHVLTTLRERQCGEALAWCTMNVHRLRKSRSPLEFRLRVQEFVELLRAKQVKVAIGYAQHHLAPWANQYPVELQRASALLAFGPETTCPPYAALYSDERWAEPVDLFKSELFRLHSLPPASLLEVHLQAGLSALKTPQSLAPECGREDPLHLPQFRQLAEGLPWAKHVHSKLICSLSGEVMTENNPPMVLPNGYVYSHSALMALSEEGGEKVRCPNTGAVYDISDLRRAYVM